MADDEWSIYFANVINLLEESKRQYGTANVRLTQYILEQLEFTELTCRSIKSRIDHNINVTDGLHVFQEHLNDLLAYLRQMRRLWQDQLDFLDRRDISSLIPYTMPTGRPGRPPFHVTKEQIEYLLSLSFSFNEIAALLGVSRTTLYRRRIEYGIMVEPFMQISDNDLQSIIIEMLRDNPFIGESLASGRLRSLGYHVTRDKVRQALRSVNPLCSALRWPGILTHRRPYSVAGPNSLWHIDGHHKLIRWRLVTHAGIDGYSRLIVYVKCSSNNRATTVYEQFLKAVNRHGLPSRVRSDQGTENILVAQHMLESRGTGRGSIITGPSIHNQRIERLWRDLHYGVTKLFYRLFYFLEQQNLLDPSNDRHLYALHYVFVPRINKCLEEFSTSWNHHRIRTANHKSPHQLFVAGLMLLRHTNLAAMDFFEVVDESFGVDDDGPVPYDNGDREGTVAIPSLNFQLQPATLHLLKNRIDPLSFSQDYGIDLYELTLDFLHTL